MIEKISFLKHVNRILQILHIRDNREKLEEYRTVFINNVKPNTYWKKIETLKYGNNSIKTSKYTLLNFLPKNLFEQFRRVVNSYFLINVILTLIIPDPPYSPITTALGLIFVVAVTGIKQGYEDILRHKADLEVNNKPIRIFRNEQFSKYKWKDIKCGDIIQVLCDEHLPCDVLLLNTKSDDRKCFVTTANLDGETNFKTKSAPNAIPRCHSEKQIGALRGTIEYEKPNRDLYEFKGKLIINKTEYPLTNENVLLRGSCLRNVPYIYGCAIYTGKDTKVMLNSRFKANKLSCTEKKSNRFIIYLFALLVILTLAVFFLSFLAENIYEKHWYLKDREPQFYNDDRDKYNLIILVFYSQLLNYLMPLNMYVSIELQRFLGSEFIQWDIKMYDPETDQPAKANTSDLNEDLGQIEYLFSDKTGTLTENVMIFKQFAINGKIYEERNGMLYELESNNPINIYDDQNILNIIDILSLCHTVQKDDNKESNERVNHNENKYQAASPDELCFIKFCLKLGIIYNGDHKDIIDKNKQIRWIKYNYNNIKMNKKFEILDVLEFDSTRKRMSIILKDTNTNKIMLYCKGAESFVLKQCIGYSVNSEGIIENNKMKQCLKDINRFAENGWRTLVLSMKELKLDEYNKIKLKLNEAYNDILDRKNKIAKIFDEIESNLILVGSTAIEDKLQDDVANTLDTIRKAGIKVWVLTGDKKETAINISYSCKHFSNDMYKFVLTDTNDPVLIQNELKKFKEMIHRNNLNNSNNDDFSYAFIIDGSTLAVLMNEELSKIDFRDICMQCTAVLCCRMSPAQKAEVVRLVKTSKSKPMTAAIGDGANDVSMIQEAHVGLGIFGKEGRNAARSADFAFAKFKFLKRILLVHGYLYYTRSAFLIQYFFYKNLPFVICQFYYAFLNAFSVTTLYDSLVLTFYNIFLTSAPILVFGWFEQKMSIQKLENNPYIYRTIKNNKLLSVKQFAKWNILAIWHSIVAFIFSMSMFTKGASFHESGHLVGSWEFGSIVITSVVIIVHVKLLIEWQYKNYFFIIGYLLSFIGYLFVCIIPSSFIVPPFLLSIIDEQNLFWNYYRLLSSPSIWFCMIASVVAAIIPDLIFKVNENIRLDKLVEKLRIIDDNVVETSKV